MLPPLLQTTQHSIIIMTMSFYPTSSLILTFNQAPLTPLLDHLSLILNRIFITASNNNLFKVSQGNYLPFQLSPLKFNSHLNHCKSVKSKFLLEVFPSKTTITIPAALIIIAYNSTQELRAKNQ